MNFKFELYMRVSCTFRIIRYNRNLAGSTCSAILNILYSLWVIVRILEIYFSLTSSWMNKCPFRVQVVLTYLNMLFIYQLKLTIFLALMILVYKGNSSIHIFVSEFSKLIFKIVYFLNHFWNTLYFFFYMLSIAVRVTQLKQHALAIFFFK